MKHGEGRGGWPTFAVLAKVGLVKPASGCSSWPGAPGLAAFARPGRAASKFTCHRQALSDFSTLYS
jgi:hypothetical protein